MRRLVLKRGEEVFEFPASTYEEECEAWVKVFNVLDEAGAYSVAIDQKMNILLKEARAGNKNSAMMVAKYRSGHHYTGEEVRFEENGTVDAGSGED